MPEARRHSFKNEQTYDLYEHVPKLVRHIKRYQAHKQQVRRQASALSTLRRRRRCLFS